ncbi:hypothetical protein [Burkholderia phage vB_BpP_HN05]
MTIPYFQQNLTLSNGQGFRYLVHFVLSNHGSEIEKAHLH